MQTGAGSGSARPPHNTPLHQSRKRTTPGNSPALNSSGICDGIDIRRRWKGRKLMLALAMPQSLTKAQAHLCLEEEMAKHLERLQAEMEASQDAVLMSAIDDAIDDGIHDSIVDGVSNAIDIE